MTYMALPKHLGNMRGRKHELTIVHECLASETDIRCLGGKRQAVGESEPVELGRMGVDLVVRLRMDMVSRRLDTQPAKILSKSRHIICSTNGHSWVCVWLVHVADSSCNMAGGLVWTVHLAFGKGSTR